MAKVISVKKSPMVRFIKMITWDDVPEDEKIRCRDNPVNQMPVYEHLTLKELIKRNEQRLIEDWK